MTDPDEPDVVDCRDCLGNGYTWHDIQDGRAYFRCPTCEGSGLIDPYLAAKLSREARLEYLDINRDL